MTGLPSPQVLLDILRSFVVFERGERTGQAIEKSPRYQKCVAVNQALARAVAGATREELRRIGRLLVW